MDLFFVGDIVSWNSSLFLLEIHVISHHLGDSLDGFFFAPESQGILDILSSLRLWKRAKSLCLGLKFVFCLFFWWGVVGGGEVAVVGMS